MEPQKDFRFDPITHTYRLGQRILPSVTDIVESVCGEPTYADDWHLNRGRALHKAIALYLKGTLDEKSVDERIRPALESAKKASKELGLTPPGVLEVPFYHRKLFYAGTPDLFSGDRLVDWKSSHDFRSEIQLGGYSELLEERGYKVKQCWEIVLEDAGYVITEYKPARSRGLFIAAYTLYGWRKGAT